MGGRVWRMTRMGQPQIAAHPRDTPPRPIALRAGEKRLSVSPMKSLLTVLALAVTAAPVACAFDWPRYLGPESTGIVEGAIRTDWKANPPRTLWTANLGRGCSSFAVSRGKAVTAGNSSGTDTIWCFDAKSGKVLWKHEYPEKLAPKYYDGGPSCTPNIDRNRVYTLSKSGKLFCLDFATGKPLWSKDLEEDLGGDAPTWGYAASPVVDGDLLYVLPCAKNGALFALDKMTGQTKWHTSDRRKAGYAAPVITEIRGRKAAVVFHGREVVAYDLSSPKKDVLFEFTWRTSYDINASNPQYHDGKLFIASGYGMGYAVLDVSGTEPEILHRERDTRMIFQNSILLDGNILGVFGDKGLDAELILMDLASGKMHWRVKLPGSRGSCALVGDTLVALCETGDLICGSVSPRGFKELGRLRILPEKDKTWAPVAVADGKIFARTNLGRAVCLDAAP